MYIRRNTILFCLHIPLVTILIAFMRMLLEGILLTTKRFGKGDYIEAAAKLYVTRARKEPKIGLLFFSIANI